MLIAVASGKGGTGKTTVATNLAAALAGRAQLIDCDVEEPNIHLFLHPKIIHHQEVTKPIPQIDFEKCVFCGACQNICQFNAIAVLKNSVLTFPELCHSCGGCRAVCPTEAIREVPRLIGRIETGWAGELGVITGRLMVGEPMAPPLIRAVKRQIDKTKIVIIDAPPGTSCSVIQSLRNCDFCLLVTEPTPFGWHDLKLAVATVRQMGIPFGVVINRADIGSGEVEEWCAEEGVPILLKIPFQREIAVAYSRGQLLLDLDPAWKRIFLELCQRVQKLSRRKSGGEGAETDNCS